MLCVHVYVNLLFCFTFKIYMPWFFICCQTFVNSFIEMKLHLGNTNTELRIYIHSSEHRSASSDSFLVCRRELFVIFIFTSGFGQTNIIQTKSRSMLSARLRLWTWQYNILMFLDNFVSFQSLQSKNMFLNIPLSANSCRSEQNEGNDWDSMLNVHEVRHITICFSIYSRNTSIWSKENLTRTR